MANSRTPTAASECGEILCMAATYLVRIPFERPVEPSEEAALWRGLGFREQDGAQGRRERERHDARQDDRDHDRHGKLLVERPGDAANERHRDED